MLLGALPETRPAALLTAPFAGNPRDDHKLWVTAVVRPIRFHDLRHTTGSLLTMRGANTGFVQRIMRHSDPRMTERYSHFDPEYLHSKLDELMRFQPAKPTTDPEPVAAVAAATPAPVTNSAAFLPTFYPTRRRVARSLTPTRRDRRRFWYLRGSGIPGSNRRHSAWECKNRRNGP